MNFFTKTSDQRERSEVNRAAARVGSRPRRHATLLSSAVVCLGASAMLGQLTLMRELTGAFSGNELIFGVALGNWMLLTGIGAALGAGAARLRRPLAALVVLQVLAAALPIADVFWLRSLRNVVFVRGAEVGATDATISCFILLAPYCLVVGCALTLASQILAKEQEAAGVGRVYLLDNAGMVIGGLLFTFALVWWCDHFQILYVAAAANLLAAGAVAWRHLGRAPAAAICAATVLLAVLAGVGDLDARSTAAEFAPQQVACRANSPYGRLVVTASAGQCNFFENGALLFSSHDSERVEEMVHYAMAQRPAARRVLLISGGVSGAAREILKYPVQSVDYVELDPEVLRAAAKFLPENLNDRRIHVICADGRRFVKETPSRYDVVILGAADPSTSQLNRFYTREFFAEVRRVLTPGGVFSFSLGEYEGYLGEPMGRLLAVAHRTLKAVFAHVLIVPGEKVYFLGSDGELTANIASRMEKAGVSARLVRSSYLASILAPDRLAEIDRALAEDAPINEDFSPVLYYHHLRHWMSQFQVRFGLMEGTLLAVLLVYVARLRAASLAIFTAGFAASSLTVVLLLGFQVLCGNVYQQVGLIFTMFMVGLGVGAFAAARMAPPFTRRRLAWLQAMLAACAACLPAILIGLGRLGGTAAPAAAQIVVPLLTLPIAALVGMSFPLAAHLDFRGAAATAARLYTADYVGAALGALLASTWLIPLIGVTAICWLIAGMSLCSAVVLAVRA